MATSTSKLGLTKPDLTDNVDVTVLNTNFDDIDTAAGFAIVTSATRPATPWTGQIIYETDTGSSFVWDGSAWQSAGGGGGSIEISATAPSSPSSGDLWWDSDNGNLYIYYDDGDSQQWVAANGPQVFVGTSAPAGYQGQLWFDSTDGKTYIYYDDGTSAQWVSAIGGTVNLTSDQMPAGSVIQVVSTTKTDAFSTTSTSFTDITGYEASITPSSASSKILVLMDMTLGTNSGTGTRHNFRMVRDATDIYQGTGATVENYTFFMSAESSASNRDIEGATKVFLDSPATTSSVTYKMQVKTGGSLFVLNRWALNGEYVAASTITLMEIAG